jgi:hypothetical protein
MAIGSHSLMHRISDDKSDIVLLDKVEGFINVNGEGHIYCILNICSKNALIAWGSERVTAEVRKEGGHHRRRALGAVTSEESP